MAEKGTPAKTERKTLVQVLDRQFMNDTREIAIARADAQLSALENDGWTVAHQTDLLAESYPVRVVSLKREVRG